jgi:phosphohistidine phosphatase
MPRLMLLRHAKSAWPEGVEDHERPLAERGKKAAPVMGWYMAAMGLVPDLAVVSTARRAQETWELAGAEFAGEIKRRDERRIYEASARTILGVIRKTPPQVETLLLVGHNPGFHELALMLAHDGDRYAMARLRKKYPTGALAVIDFDSRRHWKPIMPGDGRLIWFVTPKMARTQVRD